MAVESERLLKAEPFKKDFFQGVRGYEDHKEWYNNSMDSFHQDVVACTKHHARVGRMMTRRLIDFLAASPQEKQAVLEIYESFYRRKLLPMGFHYEHEDILTPKIKKKVKMVLSGLKVKGKWETINKWSNLLHEFDGVALTTFTEKMRETNPNANIDTVMENLAMHQVIHIIRINLQLAKLIQELER